MPVPFGTDLRGIESRTRSRPQAVVEICSFSLGFTIDFFGFYLYFTHSNFVCVKGAIRLEF